MKSLLRSILCTLSAVVLFGTGAFAQANLLISGGNAVASYVCSNSRVAVWGKNESGGLGLGHSTSPVTTPQLMPQNSFGPITVKIQQVNSGSGSHFVALTCATTTGGKSQVWCWGSNDRGQIGNGVKGGTVTAPVRVRASSGIDAAYKETVSGVTYLVNAKVVYAGNSSTYAILENGDLVSWGGNGTGANQYTHTYGILGNGTQTDSYEAVYVLTAAGQRLKNVVAVCAGDNSAYALDANGQVWSWGWSQGANTNGSDAGNGSLGRPSGQTNYATKVNYANGSPMNNIKYISCSDGAAFVIDNNNYVWAWGNGSWNSQLGVPQNATGWEPRQTVGVGGTGFLQALQVAGGQGFGMGITLDGRAVVWGGGGCQDGGGGTSIPGGTADGIPRYITSAANTAGNVTLINRADHGGWFVDVNNNVYAFGCNENKDAGSTGILGTGGSSGSLSAVTQVTLPTGCDKRDQEPFADISPKLVEVCKTGFTGQELKSGFTLGGTTAANYTITWDYSATGAAGSWTQIKTGGANTTTNKSLAATSTTNEGWYRVTVKYIGGNAPCDGFPPAVDSMRIKFYTQEFQDPGTLKVTDCASSPKKAKVYVAPKSPATAPTIANRVYNWYTASTGGTLLATTVGSATASTTTGTGFAEIEIDNLPELTPVTDPPKRIVYVEETAAAAGMFMKRSSNTCQTWTKENYLNAGNISNQSWTGFTLTEEATISELSFLVRLWLYNAGTVSTTIRFDIYAGNKIPSGTAIGSLTATVTSSSTNETASTQVATAIGSVKLSPGNYVIGAAYTTGVNNAGLKIGTTSCTLASSGNDDVTGSIIKHTGIGEGTNANPTPAAYTNVFDIKFKTSQRFCDRVPMYIVVDCPTCTKPKQIALSATGSNITSGTPKTVNLCAGESTTLSTNSITQTGYTDYTIRWFNTVNVQTYNASTGANGTALSSVNTSATVSSASLAVPYSDATAAGKKFYVLVFDRNQPLEKSCYMWDSIVVKQLPTPTATVSGGGTVCEGNAASPVIVTFANGTTPYTFTSTYSGGSGFSDQSTGSSSTYQLSTPLPNTPGTYTYQLTAFKDANGCAGTIPTPAKQTITINPTPVAEISATKLDYCAETTSGITLSLTPASGISLTGATYAWKNGNTAAGSGATITNATKGSYTCTITLNGCTHLTQAISITENPLPTYTITGDGEYCPNATSRTPVVITFTGTAPISFNIANKSDFTANSSGLVWTSTTASGSTSPGTVYQPTNIEDGNGCVAKSSTNKVTVINKTIPGLTASTVPDICVGTQSTLNVAQYVTAAGTPTYTMKSGSTGPVTSAGVLTLPSNTAMTSPLTVYVVATMPAQAGASCEASIEIPVTINPLPSATLATSPVCKGIQAELTATPTGGTAPYTNFAWTISGSAQLDAATTTAPTNVVRSSADAGTYTVGVTVTDSKGCVAAAAATTTVTVKSIPTVAQVTAQEKCVCQPSDAISFTSTPSGATFTWTNTNPVIGLAASGTGSSISSFPTANGTPAATGPISGEIWATPSLNGCDGISTKVTSITVNPLPTFTIASNPTNACQVDANNAAANVSTSASGLNGGTFVYSSSDISTINASTGAFTTAGLTPGVKTIKLDYTDGNGCKNSNTTTFTINTPPTVTLTAPANVCWNDNPVQLTVTVNGSTVNSPNGIFTGTQGGTNMANPIAAGGTSNFTYTHTDANSCVGTASASMVTTFVDRPTSAGKTIQIQSDNLFTPGENTNIDAAFPASGADAIQWFSGTTCGTNLVGVGVQNNGQTLVTGKTEADGVGNYPYQIRATKTVGGVSCYSECNPTALVITSCPAQTPGTQNAHYCLGETASLTATPWQNASNVAWFDKNPVGLTGTTFPQGGVNQLGTGTTYTPANQAAGEQIVYVAEYDPTNHCWSGGGIVSLSIHNKPAPTVTTAGGSNFCATGKTPSENPKIFTLTPAPDQLQTGSTWSFAQRQPAGTPTRGGFTNSSSLPVNDRWDATADPWTNGDTQRNLTVTYTINEEHGASTEKQATCTDSSKLTVTAQFTPAPPAVADKYWLISDIDGIPADFIKAAVQAPGVEMNWYSNADGSGSLQSNSEIFTNIGNIKQQLKKDVGSAESFTKTFYITQLNGRDCESTTTPVNLILVNCPFTAPDTTGNQACRKNLGTGLALTAVIPATTATGDATPTPSLWNWYADNGGVAGSIVPNAPTAGGNTSTYSSPAQTTTRYWVSYVATEANSGQACESQKAQVTLTVYDDPVIGDITYNAQSGVNIHQQAKNGVLCNTDPVESLTAAVNRNNTNGTTTEVNSWTVVGQSSGVISDSDGPSNSYALFDPSTWGANTADYVVKYEVTNNNGCKDSKTITIPVQYTPAPTTVDYKAAPSPTATVQISATGLQSVANGFSNVNWYATPTSVPVLSTLNPFPTGDNPNVEIPTPGKNYYATQVARACESERTPATVIIQCPVPAPLTTDRIICDYYANPELTVQGGTWLSGARPTTHAPVFTFYSAQTGGTVVGTATASSTTSTTVTWTPTLSTADKTQQQITYWVSESNDGAQPTACEGPRTAVTIQIRRSNSITINTPPAICEITPPATTATPVPAFSVSGNDPAGVIQWYYVANTAPVQDQTNPTPADGVGSGTNGSFNPLRTVWANAGTYNIWATQSQTFSIPTPESVTCVSIAAPATYTIKPQPAAPTLSPNNSCFGSTNTLLSAVGSDITWFRAGNTTAVGSNNSYQPTDVNVGTYTYEATQTVNGCQSTRANTTFRIKAIPAAPQVSISKQKMCSYDDEPTITAVLTPVTTAEDQTATIAWYSSANGVNPLPAQFSGLSFPADRTVNTFLAYHAIQTVESCSSPSAGVNYTVVAPVPAPTNTNATMCEGAATIPPLRTSSNRASWFTQESTTPPYNTAGTSFYTGNQYTATSGAAVPPGITYYVQDSFDGCVSPTSPITLTVIAKPTIDIGSDVNFCIYASGRVNVVELTPAAAPVAASAGSIAWRATMPGTPFNRSINTQTDTDGSFFITLDNTILPTAGDYTLTAIYTVASGNITCPSDPDTITVTMNDRPNAPIVSSKIICQGTTLEPIQAFGSPNIEWNFVSGAQTLPNWTGDTYDFNRFNLPSIAVGQYFFTLFDTDASTGCVSNRTNLSFEVAPEAKTKIVGRTELCATTSLEEPYHIAVVPTERSNYFWSTSGNVYNFSKDGNAYSPMRYVDWHEAGIDTVYVYERTWAGCEGFDTLLVKIAEYPQAYFTWSLPGSSTTIQYLDSSYQAPIVSKYDPTVAPIPLSYNMAWNFDRLPNMPADHIDMVVEFEDRFNPILVHDYTYGYKNPKLIVTNEFGCSSSYSTEIFVDIRAGVFIPNAFSPTNAAAGVRVFKPLAFNLEYAKFWVYDKWGNLLFYSEDVQNGLFIGAWDGTYNGELLQSDVYIWKLEAKFLDGTSWPGQKRATGGYTNFGNVTLIR
ncbi:MAG: hypothetical protein LBU90_03325 [Bacteroidales bacterium]|jgi:hypothetical protein|nr:hypothetical protein [Bacteroidales bacterium]